MLLRILGNNSALPAFGRNPTCQIVTIDGTDLMLDCGEGAQKQMQEYGVRWRNLHAVFISHLHGDHYFGLPGLLSSMSLMGRTAPLALYAPAPLEPILAQMFEAAGNGLTYPLHFTALPDGEGMLEDQEGFSVTCFPVSHRIACHGFLVTRKEGGRKLLPEKCREYHIPVYYYRKLKEGADYTRGDGFTVRNEWVTSAGSAAKRYAYCADTVFTESFLPHIKGADLIYHESTYLDADADKAAARYHTTASQAATLALKAGAGKLLLGHFSSRYRDLTPFLQEAEGIFPDVALAEEGWVYEI